MRIWWISRWQEYELSFRRCLSDAFRNSLERSADQNTKCRWCATKLALREKLFQKYHRAVPTKPPNVPDSGASAKAHIVPGQGRFVFRSQVSHQDQDRCTLEFFKAVTHQEFFFNICKTICHPLILLLLLAVVQLALFFMGFQTSPSSFVFQRHLLLSFTMLHI